MTLNYRELHSMLGQSTMIITFYKANGEIRPMLCTRNINTAAISYGYLGNRLSSFSRRCSEYNRNIGVIDLIIGDARCFKMDRLIDAHDLGVISTQEQLDKAVDQFKQYVDNYKASTAGTGLFDNIDVKTELGSDSGSTKHISSEQEKTYTAEEVNNAFGAVAGGPSIKI